MNKKMFLVFTILAVVFSLLPISSVMAKKVDQPVIFSIRNRTGATMELKLTDKNGLHHFFTLSEGISHIELVQGVYGYYASLPCGTEVGKFNFGVAKEYLFSCHKGPEITLIECNLPQWWPHHTNNFGSDLPDKLIFLPPTCGKNIY